MHRRFSDSAMSRLPGGMARPGTPMFDRRVDPLAALHASDGDNPLNGFR